MLAESSRWSLGDSFLVVKATFGIITPKSWSCRISPWCHWGPHKGYPSLKEVRTAVIHAQPAWSQGSTFPLGRLTLRQRGSQGMLEAKCVVMQALRLYLEGMHWLFWISDMLEVQSSHFQRWTLSKLLQVIWSQQLMLSNFTEINGLNFYPFKCPEVYGLKVNYFSL
jgi:hypothetical protein